MTVNKCLCALAVIVLSACASAPRSAPLADAPLTSRALSAQTLEPNACGMFVWTADSARRFILFSKASDQSALYFDGGGERALRITEQSGRAAQAQFPKQVFDTGLTLNLRAPEAISNGTRYRAGTLRGTDNSGWDMVQPVVGLSSCQR